MIEIEIPWPSPDLSPNARLHYHAKASAVRKSRAEGAWIAKTTKPVLPDGNIPVSLMFYPQTRHRFDLDGLLTRCKPYLDGIADAWGINDFRFKPITIDMGEPVSGGKVVITFGVENA